MVAQIGLTDKHTDISHWTQSCHSYIIPMHLFHISSLAIKNKHYNKIWILAFSIKYLLGRSMTKQSNLNFCSSMNVCILSSQFFEQNHGRMHFIYETFVSKNWVKMSFSICDKRQKKFKKHEKVYLSWWSSLWLTGSFINRNLSPRVFDRIFRIGKVDQKLYKDRQL